MLIAEDLLLLAYDESGAEPGIADLDHRLAGALLVELAMDGRVGVAADGDAGGTAPQAAGGTAASAAQAPAEHPAEDPAEAVVVVHDGSPTGHPALDAALAVVGERPRRARDLVEPLSRGVRERLLQGLAERGVLRREERKVLALFPVTRWPAEEQAHEAALRTRMAAVLADDLTPDPRTAALVALLKGSGLVARLVDRADRKRAEERVAELAASAWVADGVAAAVAAQAAMSAALTAVFMVTTIMPATS
jgi:hypothetical protein